jgi:hypothetical protein
LKNRGIRLQFKVNESLSEGFVPFAFAITFPMRHFSVDATSFGGGKTPPSEAS